MQPEKNNWASLKRKDTDSCVDVHFQSDGQEKTMKEKKEKEEKMMMVMVMVMMMMMVVVESAMMDKTLIVQRTDYAGS